MQTPTLEEISNTLNLEEINNTIALINRTSLTGNEATAVAILLQKLVNMRIDMNSVATETTEEK